MGDEPKNAEAAPGDTIAGNRALSVPEPSSIPTPPAGYRETPAKLRNQLRRLDADLHSELLQALVQVAERDLKNDFGRNAPDNSRTKILLERIKTAKKSIIALELYTAYLNEVHNIAVSDAVLLLEDIKTLLDASGNKDPKLSQDYSEVNELFATRARKIAEGIAAAKTKPEPK